MGGYSNPFDRPLDSEVGEHQQQREATTQASPINNPFDEPLLSEKVEAQVPTGISFDPNQPLTSYGAATRGAIGGLASDTLEAVKGALGFFNPLPQSDEEKEVMQHGGAGAVYVHRLLSGMTPAARAAMHPSEIASAIHDINKSPDPTGTYLKIAQKTASQAAGQAAVVLGTEGAIRSIPGAVKAVSGAGDVVSDVVKGSKKAQAPAQGALRTGAEASAADAGVEGTANTKGSIRSMLDDPIEKLATNERAAYDTLNKASGTDLKDLYDHANDVQEALDDPTNIANRAKLQADLKTTQEAITKGETQARGNGVDPASLKQAKAMTQQRYAMEAVQQKLFNNEAVVKGNTVHGAPESINVDSAIRQVENLDKPSKYAPRGAPTRLEQAFGEEGAKALKQSLYDAQKKGQTALSRQTFAKWAVSIAGVAGAEEAVRHVIK